MTTYTTRQQETGGTDDAPITTNVDVGDRQRVAVAGGTLVYETRAIGKELVGFEAVSDWDEVADALAARGLARGHVCHLPELDAGEEADGDV
jgi:hypothetical protein